MPIYIYIAYCFDYPLLIFHFCHLLIPHLCLFSDHNPDFVFIQFVKKRQAILLVCLLTRHLLGLQQRDPKKVKVNTKFKNSFLFQNKGPKTILC